MVRWLKRITALLLGTNIAVFLIVGLYLLASGSPSGCRSCGPASLVSGCDPAVHIIEAPFDAPYTEWDGSAEELDILEAAFRHAFYGSRSALESFEATDFVFAGLAAENGPLDPPPELMSRFDAKVEPLSCEIASGSSPGIIRRHEELPGRGISVVIQRLRVVDHDTVDVDVVTDRGCAAGHTWRLERRADGWLVVETAMWWIT